MKQPASTQRCCALTEWWEESPCMAFGSLACLAVLILVHVIWLANVTLKCHCHHMDYMDQVEHETLASYCVAYYARFCDSNTFSGVVRKCLHDREFLQGWALTHDPITGDDWGDPNSYMNSLNKEERARVALTVEEVKIPLQAPLVEDTCRLYTTLLCWGHYWMAWPLLFTVTLGIVVLTMHVFMYLNWRAAFNQRILRRQ